ncbi:MAG: nitroreductase family protein [Candidatus Kapaibacterium sp.]
MNAIDAILNRKSVRNFIPDRPVSDEHMDTLLRAGMAAPSAMNKQPWSFISIDDRETLDRLGRALPYCKMIHKASAAIVVCAHPDWSIEDMKLEYAIIDACAATENILIAAEALGLGAVWTAVYPRKDRMDPARAILGIPENVIPLNVIPIGWPDGSEQPKEKFKEDRIHQNKW